MAISYPLTLPDHEFASFNMRLARKIGTTISPFTYKAQHFENVGTQWEAEVTLPPLTDEEAKAWQIFFLSCRGTIGTFKMHPPLKAAQNNEIMRTSQAYSAGATSIQFTRNTTGFGDVQAGTWVQINEGGDSSKPHLYMALGLLNFSGQYSSATCDIQPPLRHSVISGHVCPMSPPYGLWRLASPDIGFSLNEASLYGFTFACVEAMGP